LNSLVVLPFWRSPQSWVTNSFDFCDIRTWWTWHANTQSVISDTGGNIIDRFTPIVCKSSRMHLLWKDESWKTRQSYPLLSYDGIYAGDNCNAHTNRFGHFHSRFPQLIPQTLTCSVK
jgi:hypothetical protein